MSACGNYSCHAYFIAQISYKCPFWTGNHTNIFKEQKLGKENMEKILFDVKITVSSLELFKNKFEIKEEAKNHYLATDYYAKEIHDEMEYEEIMEEYIDLFNCEDTKVIFDNYISVNEDSLTFNYAEAAESSDRAICYFLVTCAFDVEKYIKVMDQGLSDSADCPASEINGWQCTDDDSLQYAKKLYVEDGFETWAFVEERMIDEDKYNVHADAIKLSDYSEDYIKDVVESYYQGGVEQVKNDYPVSWQQIILECIFESEWAGRDHIIDTNVKSEVEAYSTIKRWLADTGVVASSCKAAVQAYENRQRDAQGKLEKEKPTDDKILVAVYQETVSPDLAGADGIGHIEVERSVLFKWFKETILPDYADSDAVKGKSDEEIFNIWLEDYLPEATVGLYDWLQNQKGAEYYIDCYYKAYYKLLDEAKKDGSTNPEDTANELFDETATAEEVVGNYLLYHGEYAFKDWMDNLMFFLERSKEKQKEFPPIKKAQDAEVTRTLARLCKEMYVADIEWNVKGSAGFLPDKEIVPYNPPFNESLTDIQGFLYNEYGVMPVKFTAYIGGERQEFKAEPDEEPKQIKPLTEAEIRCFWNEQAMFILWNDGTDSMCQENDYELADIIQAVIDGRGQVFFDGYDPEKDPAYENILATFMDQQEYENERNSRFDIEESDELPFKAETQNEALAAKDWLVLDYSSLPVATKVVRSSRMQIEAYLKDKATEKFTYGNRVDIDNNGSILVYHGCLMYSAMPIENIEKFTLMEPFN